MKTFATAFFVLTLLIAPLSSMASEQRPSPEATLIISVTDNSRDSLLSASKLIAVANEPQLDPEIYEFLGQPIGARAVFRDDTPENPEFFMEEYLQTVSNMNHYTNVYYASADDARAAADRIKSDPRIAYVQSDVGGTFSALPNDPLLSNPTHG